MKFKVEFEDAVKDKVSAKIILVKMKLWRGVVEAMLNHPHVDPKAMCKLLRAQWTVDMLKLAAGDQATAGLVQDAVQEFFVELEQLIKAR